MLIGIRLGVQLRNDADSPVDFFVESMYTWLTDLSTNNEFNPPKRPYPNPVIRVDSGNVGWFDDYDVPLPLGISGDFGADVRCNISYGKPSKRKYSLIVNKRTRLSLQPIGLQGDMIWYDVSD